MNPDLLSANVSMAFMAILSAALLAHLAHLAGPNRLLHLIYAVTAAGLIYLFGTNAFGWGFVPRWVLFALYAGLSVAVAAVAGMRQARKGDAGFPWGGMLIQQAAMAYVFAPSGYWKPPLSALLLLYFLLELYGWLKGTEEIVPQARKKDFRPPLIPPRRVRGVREFALAGVAAAFVYVFAMGTGRTPVAPPPQELATTEQTSSEAASTATPETPDVETNAEGGTESAKAPETATTSGAPAETPPPAATASSVPADTYTVASGDTLKSIAKKLYGKPEKWRAIANANPGLKPGARLKTGQAIKLPEPPTR